MGRIAGIWSKRDGGESSAGVWTGLGLEHGLLPGVAILVRGAVVRGLAVLVVWSPEQGLPRRGMRSRGVGVVQVLGREPGWMGLRGLLLGVAGELLLLVGAPAGAVWAWCGPTKPSMLGLL